MVLTGPKQSVIRAIRLLYKTQEWAQALFERLAERKRNPEETTIDRLTRMLGVTITDATAYAKELEAAGCGKYVIGRRGNESRFLWAYTCSSLGLAAIGQSDDLTGLTDETADKDDDQEAEPPSLLRLTIPQAKEALARSLGITPDKIEIIIKA